MADTEQGVERTQRRERKPTLPEDFYRAWGAIGYSRKLGGRWTLNLGLGYAQTLVYGADALGDLDADVADRRIVLGSIMTDGIMPMPLIEYQATESLSLGLSAQGNYRLPDGPFGFEALLTATWRFGTTTVYKE